MCLYLTSLINLSLSVAQRGSAEAAEAYYVDALEEWRAAKRLDSIVLLGHSLGGIIAASYAAVGFF